MKRIALALMIVVSLSACGRADADGANAAQARNVEGLDDYEQQLSFALVRYARHLCAVMFTVGRPLEEAMLTGDVQRPEGLWDWWDWDQTDVDVDLEARRVTLSREPAEPRSAVYNGDQGCTMVPLGEDGVFFEPVPVTRRVPPPEETPWPMGEVTEAQVPRGIDKAAVQSIVAEAFADNNTENGERGWVVVHDGIIVAERYGDGPLRYDRDTRNLNWSSGKSLQATLIGVLVQDGHFNVTDGAPIAEWEYPDARSLITVENLMHMAGGLDCTRIGLTDPDHYTWENDHFVAYFEAIDAHAAAIELPLAKIPGSTYNYCNPDNLALGEIVRRTVEREYEVDYLLFPQRMLFDKLGARNWVPETDPYGNFHWNGMTYASTRDWARVLLLYLQDGVWEGERILPEGWGEYVSTPSPANPSYGANFRIAGDDHEHLPPGTYWAAGAEGQTEMIIPSHDLVIARHAWSPVIDFNEFAGRIADAVLREAEDCRNNGWRRYGFEDQAGCMAYVNQ